MRQGLQVGVRQQSKQCYRYLRFPGACVCRRCIEGILHLPQRDWFKDPEQGSLTHGAAPFPVHVLDIFFWPEDRPARTVRPCAEPVLERSMQFCSDLRWAHRGPSSRRPRLRSRRPAAVIECRAAQEVAQLASWFVRQEVVHKSFVDFPPDSADALALVQPPALGDDRRAHVREPAHPLRIMLQVGGEQCASR